MIPLRLFLASALMVLGPTHGPAVAEAQNIAAIFLIHEGDQIAEKRSSLLTET